MAVVNVASSNTTGLKNPVSLGTTLRHGSMDVNRTITVLVTGTGNITWNINVYSSIDGNPTNKRLLMTSQSAGGETNVNNDSKNYIFGDEYIHVDIVSLNGTNALANVFVSGKI